MRPIGLLFNFKSKLKFVSLYIKAGKGAKEYQKKEQKIYPFRIQQRLNYMDVEVPDDDDFICKYM